MSDYITISMHPDDKEAFYVKAPYDKLAKIHRIGGKWMQSGKEWRFPIDNGIWQKFQEEFKDEMALGLVRKDLAFMVAMDRHEQELEKFVAFKRLAMKDEPTDFGVEGLGINGKNCLFNYQRWGIKCGLQVGDGFLIGDVPGLGKCILCNNIITFNNKIDRAASLIDSLDESGWYASSDGVGEWHEVSGVSVLGNSNGVDTYFPVKRVYRERVGSTAVLKTQSGLLNEFGWNHKFYTNHGWKRVCELNENDWIMCGDRIVPPNPAHYDIEDVYWLAWQIGEGYDYGNTTHCITNTDLSVLERIQCHVQSLRSRLFSSDAKEQFYNAVIKKDCRDNRKDRYILSFNHKYTEYLHDAFGYKMHTKSGDKEIPMSILNADDECVRVFVRALFDADGCCNKDNIEFSSKSYDIVEKMWYLLKRFGIFSIVSKKKVKGYEDETYWRMNIGGIYARMYRDEIGFETQEKRDALERLCQLTENTNIGYSSPCRHLMMRLVEDVLETSYNICNLNTYKMRRRQEYSVKKIREFVDHMEHIINNGVYRKKSKWSDLEDTFNRNRVARRDEAMGILSELKMYYTGAFQWLKVVSVEERGEGDYVYDFEVDDESHNYYAGGMLTHNTIQAIGIALERKHRGEIRNCLVICPASLKYNWLDEIHKFTNETALVIGHKAKNAEEREKQWIAEGYFFKIVNYELVARDLYADPKKADNRIKSWRGVLGSQEMVVFDECFSYYSRVLLEDGTLEYIGKIVAHKMPVRVMSYNWETGQFEARPIVHYFNNGKKSLLHLTTALGTVEVTPNHKYYRIDGSTVLAGELKAGDRIAVYNEFGFGMERMPLLAGCLLGDGCLNRAKKNHRARLAITHGMKQKEYAQWKARIFTNCLETEVKKHYDGAYSDHLYRIVSKSMYTDCIYDVFYGEDGKKRVTQEWLDLLDEFGLAIWYMDDGSVARHTYKKKNIARMQEKCDYLIENRDKYIACEKYPTFYRKKYGLEYFEQDELFNKIMHSEDIRQAIEDNLYTVQPYCLLHTEGYTYEEVLMMSNHLKSRFSLENSIARVKHHTKEGEYYYYLVFTVGSSRRLCEMIAPYVPEVMRYKLNGIGEAYDEEKVQSHLVTNSMLETKVLEIKEHKNDYTYNIEVEGNHNYICGGSLVSNCQYLKHHNSQRTMSCRQFNAKYRIGLSGTPLDGRLEEIHSIFQILKPGLFMSKQKFMERYAEYDYFGAVKGYHRIKEVADKIEPYYIRRKKEDVLKDLPPKIFKDMHVQLSPKNMKAYKELVSRKNDITSEASAIELLIRARQFLDFPEILGMHNTSDKYLVFKELLDNLVKDNGQKVIVFSEYTNTLHWIYKNLETEYDNILVIDGSVGSEERQAIVNRFNNDDKCHIVLCSDAAAEGLNMQKAHAVVHYTDSYKPTKMQQRNDRAHRVTTDHGVTIYRFITDGTIEEHVREILARKQAVTNALLGEDCDEFSIENTTAMELIKCL